METTNKYGAVHTLNTETRGTETKRRALTGIRTSGDVHIGNYLGMIKPALALQEEYQCFYFLADLHALTTVREPEALRSSTLDMVATWIACGLDTENHPLYRQSDVPEVAEFAWYLSCVCSMGLLEKAHAYKDAAAANREVNHGVFAYPVLMAADILMYDADVVPVGKDQKQHVEMARDMAGSFNALFGADSIHLPQPLIREEVMIIPGLDGRKMSKSYGNTIPLFCNRKQLRKSVMAIKTDSTPLEEPKTMEGSLLGQLFTLFASGEQYKDLEARLAAGGLGWGHAKEELFEAIDSEISEARNRYIELRQDEANLRRILAEGAERARSIADPVRERVRNAIGVEQ